MEIKFTKFINYKRFKHKTMLGAEVNMPALSECLEYKGVIFWNFIPICRITSQNAYDYFARNDDDQGILRGSLITEIKKLLKGGLYYTTKNEPLHSKRWKVVAKDPFCNQFKEDNSRGDFFWSVKFYNAEIEDLNKILGIIKAVK